MARKNLQASLVAKGEALRTEEQRQKQASVSFIEASRQAEATGKVAEAHAVAVEEAIAILTKAGVAL